jgi:oligopeptide/dipeptide ABC transporter ATP-binding protein
MPLLSIENLSTSFKKPGGRLPILTDLSYYVGQGEILGIVGESGSGKSMSVKTVLGLFPDSDYEVTAGKVLFSGSDLLTYNRKRLRDIRGRKITMVFQDALSALNPYLTIRTQLVEALSHTDLSKKEILRRAVETLKWVGFADARDKIDAYPFELSGGMRQRVVTAMALLPDPELIIADEPTSAIDATLSKQILDLFKRINREKNISIIFISHNFSHVAAVSDRVLVMYGGRMMEAGATDIVLSRPSHPYTRALLDSIPVAGSSITSLPFIPGDPPDLRAIGTDACPFYPRCRFTSDACKNAFPEKTVTDKKEFHCHHPLNQS